MSGPTIPDGRTSFSLLKKFIPSEFMKELLREDMVKGIKRLVHVLSTIRSLIPCFLPLMDFCLQFDQQFFS